VSGAAAGLGALVGSRTGLRARGGSLALVASAGRILQTIETVPAESYELAEHVRDEVAA